jgi:hypothetical protein
MTHITDYQVDALTAAAFAGFDFAAGLNAAPHDAQNWSPMKRGDDLPPEDYKTLARAFGDVTPEMEEQYRNGFNAEFDVSLSREGEG